MYSIMYVYYLPNITLFLPEAKDFQNIGLGVVITKLMIASFLKIQQDRYHISIQ